MITVSVLYPRNGGSKFDIDYYCNRHLPMVEEKLGEALKGIALEQGIRGPAPGSQPPYIAIAHMLFDSMDDFETAFNPHAEAIMGDTPNYTDIHPMIQINEVKM